VPELLELKSGRCERGVEISRLANRSLHDRLQLFVLTKEASMTITIYDAAYAPTAARAALNRSVVMSPFMKDPPHVRLSP
jgi:hypothetical protein